MSPYETLQNALRASPRKWLVTGVAGFIGSNLLESLLRLDQQVVGLDNFVAGSRNNLDQVRSAVAPGQWQRFRFIEGDITNLETCREACHSVQLVLHQAALGSVPASMANPLGFHATNVTGFLNMLIAARDAGAGRFVYASSSAVYGDDPSLPKREDHIGRPLSPYAASKAINEVYAAAFSQAYSVASIGLRYFNVFGPRQNPEGAYAAVIPQWIRALVKREPVYINGDGETSRDFCYVENVVQANLLAAMSSDPAALNQCFNIAFGRRTTLKELFRLLQETVRAVSPSLPVQQPVYRDFRPGDIRHSLADIAKAGRLLGYAPARDLHQGLRLAMPWYRDHLL